MKGEDKGAVNAHVLSQEWEWQERGEVKFCHMCRMNQRDFMIHGEGDTEEEASTYHAQETG